MHGISLKGRATRLNPLSLAFSGENQWLEARYLDQRAEQSKFYIRISLILGIFIVSAFGILDQINNPQNLDLLWPVRFGVMVGFGLGVLIYSFYPGFTKHYQIWVNLVILVTGMGSLYMHGLNHELTGKHTYAGFIIIFLWGYAFIRARFIYASVTCGSIVLGYYLVARFYMRLDSLTLLNNCFYLFGADLAGMFIAYLMEYSERKNFVLQERLRQDIAEIKRMEQALRRSEKFMQRALDTVEDPFYVKDQKHRWWLLNDAACQMLGRTRKQLLGKDDYSIFPPEQVDVFWAHDNEVLKSGRTILKEVQINWGKEGKPRIISTKKSLFTDPVTGEKLVVGTIRDISRIKAAERENRRLEAQLRQSQKMEAIGTLAGGIAHDFNNILGAIVGFTDIAKDKIAGHEDPSFELDHVLGAAEKARNLIRQILLFSRKASLEMKNVDLNLEVRQAIGLLKRTLPKNIKIIEELKAEPGLVLGDSNQLAQVVMNLASNAADAMVEGGTLTISTNSLSLDSTYGKPPNELEPGPYVELCLEDSGCGIEPSLLAKIFDPFFTTKPVGKGTGLGLSTVFGIVKSHSGVITCESAKSKGSIFKVILPALDHSKWLGTDLFRSEGKAAFQGYETVLLVDDDPAIRQMLQGMLLRSGYEVMAAATGEEALELFGEEREKVELVILDLDMPGMGGVRCLESLKKQKPEIKVLIASGHAGSSLVDKAMALGASSFMDKPFTKEEFLVGVRKVLDGK
ncbi:hybrid sensor histidine kinase/response regulator [Dethiosulfatarculus sandiegensis]|uniref:histidine kinase n=1 Tax=Dethiosulfatarculus sandiegensis TaxID=1429043 RepID=A0A0D2GCE0_9BACT|nr:response regulator [Dethiosulfatarculus sandiegensis]KIX12552.1 hypothetical protein X474_18280 [Dethiosulfatarculus sandiegensis]